MENALKTAALKVCRFVRNGNYAAIIVSGGSNQLSRSLLAFGWRKLYGNAVLPKIFVFPRKVNHLMYKSSNGVEIYRDWVQEWITTYVPDLTNYQNSPICLVDDYAMTGLKCTELAVMF